MTEISVYVKKRELKILTLWHLKIYSLTIREVSVYVSCRIDLLVAADPVVGWSTRSAFLPSHYLQQSERIGLISMNKHTKSLHKISLIWTDVAQEFYNFLYCKAG